MPSNAMACRAYDLAATERSQANKDPDPTACAKMYKDREGYYYIAGEYHGKFYDSMYDVYGQFCKRSGDRDNHILMQAGLDGADCPIVLPVDPGAAGKTAYESMAKTFTQHGYMVKKDPMPQNKTKLTRFQPFATACENGLVFILEDTFDKKTLDFICKQLEAFDGERSTKAKHDEFPDLLATAFNYLSKGKDIQPFSVPSVGSNSRLRRFKESLR